MLVIVGPHAIGGIVLHLLNRLEEVVAEPVVAYRPVVAFDIGILLRVTGLDVIKPDALAFGSGDKDPADVLRAVVTADDLRFAVPLDDLVQ